MRVLDIILINIYKFLNQINFDLYNNNQTGVKLHTYIVFSGILGLNFFNLLSILYFNFSSNVFPEYLAIVIILLSFAINFYIYYTKNRFDKLFSSELMKSNFIHYLLTFIYVFATFYFTFSISQYIREHILSK